MYVNRAKRKPSLIRDFKQSVRKGLCQFAAVISPAVAASAAILLGAPLENVFIGCGIVSVASLAPAFTERELPFLGVAASAAASASIIGFSSVIMSGVISFSMALACSMALAGGLKCAVLACMEDNGMFRSRGEVISVLGGLIAGSLLAVKTLGMNNEISSKLTQLPHLSPAPTELIKNGQPVRLPSHLPALKAA